MSGVTDLQFDPTGVARRTLDEVVRDHGPAALDDARLMGQLLPDLMAGAEREAALVSAAAGSGVGSLLTERVSHGIPIDAAIRDISLMLSQRHAYDVRACDWIVTEYARILGVPVSPSTLPVARSAPESHEPPTTTQDPGTSVERSAGTVPERSTGTVPYLSEVSGQPPGAVRQSPDRTRVDAVPQPGAPENGTPPVRRRRTGLVVAIVVVVLLAAAVVVVLATRKSTPPKTGADCLIGTWRTSSVLVRDGIVSNGGLDTTYRPGGTGEGSINYTETLTSGDGGTVTVVGHYTFNYAATDGSITPTDGSITYTNVQGTINTTGPNGPDNEQLTSVGDESFSCTGDQLLINSPDLGGSQLYERR